MEIELYLKAIDKYSDLLSFDLNKFYLEDDIVIYTYLFSSCVFDQNDQSFKDYLKRFNIELKALPLGRDYHKEEALVLTIFGDDEPNKHESLDLHYRKKNNHPTLPLVIFSDDFFEIPTWESFSYMDIVDAIGMNCTLAPVALAENDLELRSSFINQYFYLLSHYAKTQALLKKLKSIMNDLELLIYQLEKNQEGFSLLYANTYVQAINEKRRRLLSFVKDSQSLLDKCASDFVQLQHEIKIETIKRRKYFKPHKYKSKFATDLLLKYGHIQKLVDDFKQAIASENILIDSFAIQEKLDQQEEILNSVGEMAVIGTFSSGKTTLINSLLSAKHCFRTSGKHNTAVLLKLFGKAMFEEESYETVFKRHVDFDLVSYVEDSSSAILFRKDGRYTVTHVDHLNGVIHYRSHGNQKKDMIFIPMDKKIVVKKHDIIQPLTRLTDGPINTTSDGHIKIMAQDELMTLCNEIDNKHLVNYKLYIERNRKIEIVEKKQAKKILQDLTKISEKRDKISPSQLLYSIYLENVKNIHITATYKKENIVKTLNEDTWKNFSQESEETTYLESPECYMFAKEIQAYLHSEFLEYCHVIDTPGFGSVTEKHDAISERYLREHAGLLVVVIKVTNKTMSKNLFDLLDKISSIYNSDPLLEKENVYFALNCYDNLINERAFETICKSVNDQLKMRKFSTDKMFVFNLKKSMESNEFFEEMYGFPSYKKFYSAIKIEIEKRGMNKQYKQIKRLWDNYFEREVKLLQKANKELQKSIGNSKKIISQAKRNLERAKHIDLMTFPEIRQDYLEHIEDLKSAIHLISKKKEWKREKDYIFNIVDTISNLQNMMDDNDYYYDNDVVGQDYYHKIASLTSAMNHNQNEDDYFKIDSKKKRRFIIPVIAFKELFESIVDNRVFWIWKRSKYRDELLSFIDSEVEKSLEEIKEVYYKEAQKRFMRYKNQCIKSIKNTISIAESDSNIQSEIEQNKQRITIYKKFSKKWDIVSNAIDERCEEATD